MTECRFAGTNQPRTIPARHTDDCHDDQCRGCQPCDRGHCRICGIAHTTGTCPECMAETRETLREIARLCDALPEEVEHRGVEGEAMMLLAPAVNYEARGYLEASFLAGRVDRDALGELSHRKECNNPRCLGCVGELHPEAVLGTWESVYRAELEHDEPADLFKMAETVRYLDEHLTAMGSSPWVPFEDFAADLRRCRAHLEAVLHDSDHGVRANVPCFDCGGDLERKLGKAGFEDTYTCRRCRRVYTIAEYNFALRASLEKAQEEVPA